MFVSVIVISNLDYNFLQLFENEDEPEALLILTRTYIVVVQYRQVKIQLHGKLR